MPNRSDTQVITPGLLRDWALPVPEGGKGAGHRPGGRRLPGPIAVGPGLHDIEQARVLAQI